MALVEYTRLYKPYRKACDYLEELLKEREEDEKQAELESLAKDHEMEKVREAFYILLLCPADLLFDCWDTVSIYIYLFKFFLEGNHARTRGRIDRG